MEHGFPKFVILNKKIIRMIKVNLKRMELEIRKVLMIQNKVNSRIRIIRKLIKRAQVLERKAYQNLKKLGTH